MRDISNEVAYSDMFGDVYNHVVGCQTLSVYNGINSDPIAFIASSIRNLGSLKVYHLGGIVLTPEIQGNGFALGILEQGLAEAGAEVLAFHTQSRVMEKLGLKVSIFCSDLAKRVAMLLGTGSHVNTTDGPIDKGRYGGSSLYGDAEAFEPIAIKRPGFDYCQGDAIVFAGYVKRKGV